MSKNLIYIFNAGVHVKIGFTRGDPEERLKSVQTGNPHKVTICGLFDVSRLKANIRAIEREIHTNLDGFRCEGEWFQIKPNEARKVVSGVLTKMTGKDKYTYDEKSLPSRVACVPLRLDLFPMIRRMNNEQLTEFARQAFDMKHRVDLGEMRFVMNLKK